MNLVIREAQLAENPPGQLVDIGVVGGRIVAIEPDITTDASAYEAGGRLACGGFVETHIHLDKARLLERCPAEPGRAINPVRYVAPFKHAITCEDVYERAEASLCECLLHGTTRIRSHVEVDPGIELRGFEAVRQLAADYAWAVDLEICAFAQEGLTNVPGADELLVRALNAGAQVVGGAPRYDADGPAQIRRVFALAREFDVDVDLHLDVGPTADHLDVHLVCDLTEEHGLGGRVTVGHMAKLSLLPPDALASVARRLADVGVAVTVLPATDLYLMGRDRDHAVPRGVADAEALLAEGVNCSISSNNVLNPATPFGDCSLVRMANLHANVLQTGLPEEVCRCFEMITTRSARLLNATDYGIAIGHPADLVILDARSAEETIRAIRPPLASFKRGRQTMAREAARLIRP